jgi:hypothetical protein
MLVEWRGRGRRLRSLASAWRVWTDQAKVVRTPDGGVDGYMCWEIDEIEEWFEGRGRQKDRGTHPWS